MFHACHITRGIRLAVVLLGLVGCAPSLYAQQLPGMPAKPARPAPSAQTPRPVEAQRPAVPTTGGPVAPAQINAAVDERIARALREAYSQIDALAKVNVRVRSGVVTVQGQVARPSARDNAAAIAGRIAGVLFVNNKLVVAEKPGAPAEAPTGPSAQDEAIQQRLSTIFGHVDALRDVRVDVASGVVHLSGQVSSPEAIKKAGELASSLEGVLYVDNELQETRDFSQRIQPTVDKLDALASGALVYIPLMVVALLILGLFWLLARLLTRADFLYGRLRERPLVQNIVRQVVGSFIMLVGVVAVLEIFDVTSLVGAVLGTAGVAGIALGFAFRDIGENYLSSIVLSMRRPFRQNDFVRIDDFEGKVVRLTTRDTVLMTLDGNHVRVPNSVVFKSVIYNYSSNPRRRFAITAGVDTGEDLVAVRRIGIEALCGMEGVLDEPPPFARVEQLGDSNVRVTFYGWVDQQHYDYLNVQSEAIYMVKTALDTAGVQMPEPIYRINVNPMDTSQPAQPAPKPQPIEPAPASVVNLEAESEIDDQIAEERQRADEPDLLDE